MSLCNTIGDTAKQLLILPQSGDVEENPTIDNNVPLNEGSGVVATPETVERTAIQASWTKQGSKNTIITGQITGCSTELRGAVDYTVADEWCSIHWPLLMSGFKVHNEDRASGIIQYRYDSFRCHLASILYTEDNKQKTKMFNAGATAFAINGSDSNFFNAEYTIGGRLAVDPSDPDMLYIKRDGNNVAGTPQLYRPEPPIFQGAGVLNIGGETPMFSGDLSIDSQLTAPTIRNGNVVGGVEGVKISDRRPVITFRILTPLASEKDYWKNMIKNTKEAMTLQLGESGNGGFKFEFPAMSYTTIDNAPENNTQYLTIAAELTATADDEEFTLTTD